MNTPRLPVALACLAVSACVPYVLPPVTADVGLSFPSVARGRAGVRTEVGFSPMQLSADALHRNWDVVASGSLEYDGVYTWGASLAAGPVFHPWRVRDARTRSVRLSPQLVGHYGEAGWGAGLRLNLESATFRSGSMIDRTFYGEAALGAFVEAGFQEREREPSGAIVLLGLTFRLPAAAGIACCVTPN